jgi:hypothetical protein
MYMIIVKVVLIFVSFNRGRNVQLDVDGSKPTETKSRRGSREEKRNTGQSVSKVVQL